MVVICPFQLSTFWCYVLVGMQVLHCSTLNLTDVSTCEVQWFLLYMIMAAQDSFLKTPFPSEDSFRSFQDQVHPNPTQYHG